MSPLAGDSQRHPGTGLGVEMPTYKSNGPGPGNESSIGLWVLLGLIVGLLTLMGIASTSIPTFIQ